MPLLTSLLLGCVVLAGCTPPDTGTTHSVVGTLKSACPWRTGAIRPTRPDERPHEEQHPLLRELEDPKIAPGPSSLVAVVKSDSSHHPFIYIEDTSSGSSHRLLERSLSQPRWSPNGRFIASTAWESRQKPWMLTVVNVGSGEVVQPEFGAVVSSFKWAPDSKSLAVAAVLYGKPICVLVLVSIPSGETRMIDTLEVHADYDLSWSPDSRWLAVARPTTVDAYEEVTEAELWLLGPDGARCQLADVKGTVQNPRWIDDTRLSYVTRGDLGQPGSASRVTIELVRTGTAPQ